MRIPRLFERPYIPEPARPPIGIVGNFPGYALEEAYEGRVDVVNAVGRCRIEVLETDLPEASQVMMDNFLQQVVIKFPAQVNEATDVEEVLNPDFQTGDLSYWNDVRGSSYEVASYPGFGEPPENMAAYMRGVGRGDHVLESMRYRVRRGERIFARSLWDQGPSNKDNNNLYTVIAFYGEHGTVIHEEWGDRIHDRTNKERHWSTVDTVVPNAAEEATIRLVAHRRNGRNREIIVDNVEAEGFYYSPALVDPQNFSVTFRVTDTLNRSAVHTAIIPYGRQGVVALDEVYFSGGNNENFSVQATTDGSRIVAIVTGRTSLYYSDDFGDTWEELPNFLPYTPQSSFASAGVSWLPIMQRWVVGAGSGRLIYILPDLSEVEFVSPEVTNTARDYATPHVWETDTRIVRSAGSPRMSYYNKTDLEDELSQTTLFSGHQPEDAYAVFPDHLLVVTGGTTSTALRRRAPPSAHSVYTSTNSADVPDGWQGWSANGAAWAGNDTPQSGYLVKSPRGAGGLSRGPIVLHVNGGLGGSYWWDVQGEGALLPGSTGAAPYGATYEPTTQEVVILSSDTGTLVWHTESRTWRNISESSPTRASHTPQNGFRAGPHSFLVYGRRIYRCRLGTVFS